MLITQKIIKQGIVDYYFKDFTKNKTQTNETEIFY